MGASPASFGLRTAPRDVRLYVVTTVCSALIHFGQGVAVGWSVYEQTGAPLALGFVGLAQFLPIAVLFLPAGHLADRVERRRMVLVSLLLTFAATLLLAYAAWRALPVGWTYAALVLSGCGQILYRPARDALLPALLPPQHLARGIALASALYQVASLAAPAAVGFGLAQVHSAVPIHLCNALLAALALLATIAIRQRSHGQPAATGSRVAEVLAGFRHVWRTRILLAVMSVDLVAVLFGGAVALLPVYARDILHVGPAGLGLLSTAPALGAACAGLVMTRSGVALDGRVLLAAVGGFGVATIVFGLSTAFPLSLAALAVAGGCDCVSVVLRQTVLQQATPDALRGRVGAVNRVFVSSSNELGALESGLAAAWFGPLLAVAGGGAITVLVALGAPALFPVLRALRHDRPLPRDPAVS